jgi:hypothetical protein
MKNVFPGVEVTADKIGKVRPHLSKNDFYKKYSEIKRSIDDYGVESLGKKVKIDFYPFDV